MTTKLVKGTAPQEMLKAVKRCQEETNKDPVAYHRLEVFEAVSRFATDVVQIQRYQDKAARCREMLKN